MYLMEGTSSETDCCVDGDISTSELNRPLRNKKRQLDPVCCPICSITLRSNEIQAHLESEIEKLDKISGTKQKANGKSCSPSTSTPNGTVAGHTKEWKTFQKIQLNRLKRQRISIKRSHEDIVCPMCNDLIQLNVQEHLSRCVRNMHQRESEADVSEDDNIDIEGDVETYEWAGQERIRTTSLLEGGVASLGTAIKRTDEDDILVVDGDTNTYGPPQYSEDDIRITDENVECEDAPDTNNLLVLHPDTSSKSNIGLVLEALKNRVCELENRPATESFKCLICMERYKTPVISICCWHVYCENCWLQTLSVKKLCPQCNMITSPTDLRRIYI